MGRELGAVALAQLEAWERYAREWPLRLVPRENGTHLVCAVCEQTLLPVTYHDQPYTFTGNTTLAATVAHLRNVHRWVEPEVYANGNQDEKANYVAGNSSANNGRGAYSD
jgi:hypothetical protein